jgi:MFS family permease
MSTSFFLGPMAQSYGTLTALNVMGGMGNGLSSGLLMTIGGDLAPEDSRAQFLAIYRVFCDCGVMMGPLASGVLTEKLSVRGGFWAISLIALIAAVWMVLLVPETHRPAGDKSSRSAGSAAKKSAAKEKKQKSKKQKSKRVVKVKGGGSKNRTAYAAVQHESNPMLGETTTLEDL